MNNIDLSSNSLVKGTVHGNKTLVAWDSIPDCQSSCPLYHDCIYQEANSRKSIAKCTLQREYLESFTNMVFSTYRCMTEDDLYKVGMHLIPLYSQLCRQKILEKSLRTITVEDSRGNLKMHPIYKEMRETLKTITMVWRDLGIMRVMNPDLPTSPVKNDYGDPEHYKRISKVVDRKVTR